MLLLVTFFLNYIYVDCLIENLSVQKLDRQLIQRRRQDTLDLCHLFNAEENFHSVNDDHVIAKKSRSKREVDNGNDVQRIENIVDKVYDDDALGKDKKAYKQKEEKKDIIARRFNFAPAKISGPIKTNQHEYNKNPLSVDDRNARIPWHKAWQHGIIPYYIDLKSYDNQLSEAIRKAFNYIEKMTCIRLQRLRDKPTDKLSVDNVEWIYITNPFGIRQCVHSNERKPNKGVQTVVFGYNCMSTGEIVHEIMHVLGFSHEHTRPNRDLHVSILWDNIKPGYRKYFQRRTEDPFPNLAYDFNSLLHYPPRAFSKNGKVTIVTEPGVKIGQREVMSALDAQKIDLVYGIDCIARNRNYLLKTCPSAVKVKQVVNNVTQEEIHDYFRDRLWTYGVVNYNLRVGDFSYEEEVNIQAVIRHIEKETCIEFRDMKTTKHKTGEDFSSDEKTYTLAGDETTTNTIKEDNEVIETVGGVVKNSTESLNAADNADMDKSNGSLEKNDVLKLVSNESESNQTDLEDNNKNKKLLIRDYTLEPGIKYTKPRLPFKDVHSNPNRRHASNILVLAKSTKPGCKCPQPGKTTGEQKIEISVDCFSSVNDLLHVFVHILGLDHQHNMHDRDSYLHILWDKLSPDVRSEMSKKLPKAASVGFPYDYQSVMHYPWLQIKNGITNIMYPIWNDGWAMGQWQGLSSTDVQKLNLLYYEQCQERKRHTVSPDY